MRHPITSAQGFAGSTKPDALARQVRVAYARFQRLDRAKQAVLVGLAAMGCVVVVAALITLALPDPAVQAASPKPATSFSAQSGSTTNLSPALAGQFMAQLPGHGGAVLLDLHQYGADLTGSFTTIACASGQSQVTSGVVNGHVLDTGDLTLTFSAPNQPHSTTTVYHLAANATGFDLAWRDSTGHAQSQHWAHLPGDQVPATATTCPAA